MDGWGLIRSAMAELFLHETRNFLLALVAISVVGLISLALVIWNERHLPPATLYRLERAWERCESTWRYFELALSQRAWLKAAARFFKVFWLNYIYYKMLTFVGRIDTLIVAGIASIAAAALGNDFWDFALKVLEVMERS